MGSSFGGQGGTSTSVPASRPLQGGNPRGGRRPLAGPSTSTGGVIHMRTPPRCAPGGVWDLMAPQSPDHDRWATWFYYTQGSEAFKGDLYFYSVDHDP